MPLGWDQKKKLARLTGLVVDVSRSDAVVDATDRAALDGYLRDLESEIQGAFFEGGDLSLEFERLFRRDDGLPPQVKAAAIGGWLKELLAADAHEMDVAPPSPLEQQLARKVSVGFKLRSPIVREEGSAHEGPSSGGGS